MYRKLVANIVYIASVALAGFLAMMTSATIAASLPAPTRVHVSAYYGKYFGGIAADPKWMAAHADFVQGEPATVGAFKRAGGRYGVFYTDPFRIIVARKEPYYDLPESAWLHDTNQNRMGSAYRGSNDIQYFSNPSAPETQAAFAQVTQSAKATSAYDFIFLDDAAADLRGQFYPSTDTPAELKSDADLVMANEALMRRSALPIIFNGLSNIDESLGHESLATQFLSVADGGLAEGCFANNARLKAVPYWTSDAESLLATTRKHKWAICMIGAQRGVESQSRLFGYASWLLTYDGSHSVVHENLYTPSRVEIFPEQSLVPTKALKTAHHIWDLSRPDGAYVREFAKCYYQGKVIGACAAVVNPTSQTVAVPRNYTKEVILVGDGLWDGGTLVVQTGAPTSLEPGFAAILVR